jgi:NAD(P)-dependent dehydrogenase (short-subunit alcohol dehydrogenase family)
MEKEFEGKTAFITGGGTGIGQAAAFALARAGVSGHCLRADHQDVAH